MSFLADLLEPFIGDPGAENPVPTPVASWADSAHVTRKLVFSYPYQPTQADVQSVTVALGPYRALPWLVQSVQLAAGTWTVVATVKNLDNEKAETVQADINRALNLEGGAWAAGSSKLAEETANEITGDWKKYLIIGGLLLGLVVFAGIFFGVKARAAGR